MAEHIEREKVYEMLNALGGCGAEPESWADGWDKAIDTAINELNKIPAADVRPERHGEWIFEAPNAIGFFPVKCSNCGIKIATTGDPCDWINEPDHAYCGACGAKMDGNCKSDKWIATSEQLPLENQIVDTKIDDEKGVRNEQELIYSHNLWFLPDKSMYVYYTPTHWRYKANMDGKDDDI